MNETALKERLKIIALEKDTTVNNVWKQLLLERFLARLSHSSYQNNFIFKGGLLLAKYIDIKRETTDIDFLIDKITSEKAKIEAIIKDITEINFEDHFYFKWSSLEELHQPHMEYIGFRVTLDANFGKMRDKIQIDIGVGDIVDPLEISFEPFEYRGKPMFSGEISLYVYPPEAIFAEKYETIISKGPINSRMKDYHDLILMIREKNFIEVRKLVVTIAATFNRRKTQLISIQFDKKEILGLEKFWSNHLRALGKYKNILNLPETIEEVITELNDWMKDNEIH
jgi:predicted nucleotidyltransferase component of viral defense system